MKRKDPNLKEKLGALIIAHLAIPHEIASKMSRKEILALLAWDHFPVQFAIARDLGWGPERYNHPSNLVGRFEADHAIKTAKIDVPQIAKADRISDAHRAFRQRLLAKTGIETGQETGQRKRKSRLPTGRKIPSRPFPKRITST